MSRLIFEAKDVRRVVEHSLANKQSEQLVSYDQKTGEPVTEPVPAPAVLLVHDQGVYLMSNGRPRDIVAPDSEDRKDKSKDEGRSYVAYAEGCNPDTDEEWWDTARALVGGDDFGETLPWAKDIMDQINRGAAQIVLSCTGEQLALVPFMGKRK
jgi:hypothetical protein